MTKIKNMREIEEKNWHKDFQCHLFFYTIVILFHNKQPLFSYKWKVWNVIANKYISWDISRTRIQFLPEIVEYIK